MSTPGSRTHRWAGGLAALTLSAVSLTACGSAGSAVETDAGSASSESSSASSSASGSSSSATATDSVWEASTVHEVSIDVDEKEYDAMIAAYEETGEKEWITVDVTIDGVTFRDVGLRLKGNSSLRSADADADPADLPWLIDLDKFVDGQSLEGWEKFVIRSNNSETALNEAVALDLLQEAGLASTEAVSTRFSVNGGEEQLRLMVQDLDEAWDEANFGVEGILYKSEAGGDWSYRGEDAASYEDVFDIEAGDEDYAPLAEFLRWLNSSSDEEFAEGLDDRLDVEAFATYLALEDLIGNTDDIEGPGNNSYLRWDAETGTMTVVAWDHNLAFGGMGLMGGMDGGDRPGGEGFEPPADGGEPPEGFEGGKPPEGFDTEGGGRGFGGNILAERFHENEEFEALYDDATERLQAELFDSGTAQEIVDTWTTVLKERASDLVDEATVDEEAAQIASYFDGEE